MKKAEESPIEAHYKSLGFGTFQSYADWCGSNGFGNGKRKSLYEMGHEREYFRQENASRMIRKSRALGKLRVVIRDVRSGKIKDDNDISGVGLNQSIIK